MCDALGIVNFEDSSVDIAGLSDYRPVSAISIMGRYRVIDFVLSNMTNSGIQQIQVYCREKPRSLIEHLGTGSHYNINTKRGKLRILYGEEHIANEVYNSDVANFMQNMQYIEESTKPYVVVAPSYMLYSMNYEEVLKEHIASGADVTLLYNNTEGAKEFYMGCDTLTLDSEHRITDFQKNLGKYKSRAVSLECYVMSKQLFMDLVKKAADTSSLYWFKDILHESCQELLIKGYPVKSFCCCINSLSSYYKANMELRNKEEARHIFGSNWPIHTITNDSVPTKYEKGSKCTFSVVANGCQIEGTVTGSVIGRNVTVKKGAVVKDCVLLPGCYIGEGAKLDHVVVDKNAIIHHVKKLVGTDDDPIYVKRRDRI